MRKLTRSLLLPLLLPLLLLFAQQGRVWHELGHVRTALAAAGKQQLPAEPPCELCLAFAQAADAVAPGFAAMPVLPPGHAPALADAVAFIAADAPAQRSRGPPDFL